MIKPSIILLHGALGSKRYFIDLKKRLLMNFQVYDLNFEGHGGDLSEKPFSIDLFTNNLIAFLKENNLEQVAVFGYSMGGYVALTAALRQPELIGDILTLGTKFEWSPAIAAKEVRMLNPEIIEEKVPKFAANLKTLHEPVDWKVVMHKTADLMLGLGNGVGLQTADFEKIKHRVIIGIGDQDKMVTQLESELHAGLLPNGSFRILEGVPHPIEMINLDVLTTYILKSLGTV